MTLAAKPFKPAIFLALLAALSLAALAQEGGVSSNVTSHDASAPATSDSKPLPWKFLASPMVDVTGNKFLEEKGGLLVAQLFQHRPQFRRGVNLFDPDRGCFLSRLQNPGGGNMVTIYLRA